MGLFLLRFLVPSPVGLADNGDGPRLMCGLGVASVTGGHERYDAYAYFRYAASPAICAHASVYQSSEHELLVAARWLTPVLGLSGQLNLIALGVVTCILASVGIASLACGLGRSWRSRLVVAGVLWLVMADVAFFANYAGPVSEGATLTGLLLVAAGLVYLGRGPLAAAAGIALATAGAYLTILSKEQYLPLVVPVCLGLLLAATTRDGRRGIDRWLTGQMAATVIVTGLLAATTAAYAQQDATSPYSQLLHQEQVVDVIFDHIVNGHDNAPADLHALHLPVSWSVYAKSSFWSKHSVYDSPLYSRYAGQLTDANLAHFLLTHPFRAAQIAQQAAQAALQLRPTYLGNYPPGAHEPPGAMENRVGIISSLVGVIPSELGLLWLLPLWAAMAGLAIVTLRRPRRSSWHHDAAIAALVLTGSAMAAFIPAAFFAGVETTRHMLGTNMATALACVLSAALLASLLRSGLSQNDRSAPAQLTVPAQPPAPAQPPVPAQRDDAPPLAELPAR